MPQQPKRPTTRRPSRPGGVRASTAKLPPRPRPPTAPVESEEEHDGDQGRVSPLLTSRGEARRKAFVIYMILLGVALVVGVGLIFANQFGGEPEDEAAESLAPVVSENTLRAAFDKGVAGMRAALEEIKTEQHKRLSFEEPSNLEPTIVIMREMKKHDGSNAGYDAGEDHRVACKNPTCSHYFVLRVPLPRRNANPVRDVEYVILRAYTSESLRREALELLRAKCSSTTAEARGSYVIAQYTHNLSSAAYNAIEPGLRRFDVEFLRQLPPEKKGKP